MAAADEQFGNKGYGQIGSYGGNPYDSRDPSPAGYNNYNQGGGYGMFKMRCTLDTCLTQYRRCRDAILRWWRKREP